MNIIMDMVITFNMHEVIDDFAILKLRHNAENAVNQPSIFEINNFAGPDIETLSPASLAIFICRYRGEILQWEAGRRLMPYHRAG